MFGSIALVVIDDLHIVGVTIYPAEADAPLVIYPDAVLALEVTFERFKPVGWRNPQIVQGDGVVEHTQLATRHGLDIGRQPPGWRSAPDLFGFLVGEVPDHHATITLFVI